MPKPIMSQRDAIASTVRQDQKHSVWGKPLIYAALVIWGLLCIFPLYWIVITSFKDENAIGNGPFYIPFVDFMPSLDSWSFILTYENDFLVARFYNSVIVGVTSTLLTVLVGAMAVYGLTRFRYALPWTTIAFIFLGLVFLAGFFSVSTTGLHFFFAIAVVLALVLAARVNLKGPVLSNYGIIVVMMATRILPPMVVLLPIFMMAQVTGMSDTRIVLILTYASVNLPVVVWLILPVFGPRATEQEEAAQLDGASHLLTFFTIFLPMVASSLAAVGLLILVLCWNEYFFAVELASNNSMTLPPWIIGQMSIKEAQAGGDNLEWARLSAAMTLMIIPLLVCAVFVQRFMGRMFMAGRLS
jgi:multiple sugar transport system permease protein